MSEIRYEMRSRMIEYSYVRTINHWLLGGGGLNPYRIPNTDYLFIYTK